MYQNMWPDVLPRAGNQRLEMLDSVSPWFEVYRVSDRVFALLEPNHREEAISYLILGSERAVLLDTGMGIGNIQTEVDRLTDLPVIAVVSHGHYDHIGDNHRYSEAFVAKTALVKVEAAFEQIVNDAAPYEAEGNVRVYRFEGFGLVVPV